MAELQNNQEERDTLFDLPSKSLKTRGKTSLSSIYSAASFEKAISEAGYGKFNYLLLLLALPASCSSTFDTASLSFALPTATCDLDLDAFDRGYLNGAIFAGMILSSFFWGFVADKFGRQRILVFGYLGDVVFSVAASFSQDFWSLLTFKFFSGVMICGPYSIFLSYLSEMFNSKHRDSIILAFGLFQAIGGVFQPLIALGIIPQHIHMELWEGRLVLNSWRLFLLVCTLPALVAGFGITFCHESPRFLMSKGRKDEALRVFRSIYSTNTGKHEDTYSVKKLKSELCVAEPGVKPSAWQQLTALFRPPHLTKALLIFGIQFGGLMALNTIRLWLPQLIYFIKKSPDHEYMDTCEILGGNNTRVEAVDCDNFNVDTHVYSNMLIANILVAVSFAICTATVRFVSKKVMLVTLFVLQAVVLSPIGWVKPPFITTLAALFVALSNTGCIGLLGFAVQMFPTNLRTMAVSLTMMFGRIGVCIGNVVLPYFLSLSCRGTFIGLSAITLLCGLVLYILATVVSRGDQKSECQSTV